MVLDANVERLSDQEALRRMVQFRPDAVVAVTGAASWQGDCRFLKAMWQRLQPRVFLSGGFLLTEGERVLQQETYLEGVLLNYMESGLERYLRHLTRRQGNFNDLAIERGDKESRVGGKRGA